MMKSLIKEARSGDSDAFAELMQSQMKNMYKAARAILYHDEDVADAIDLLGKIMAAQRRRLFPHMDDKNSYQ